MKSVSNTQMVPIFWKYGWLFVFICFPIVNLVASDSLIDSLEKKLQTLPDNAEKIDVYLELVRAYYSGEKALKSAQSALTLSKQLSDRERIGISYRKIGWSYYTVFDLNRAVVYADSALSILEGTDLYKGLESAYSLKAILFMEYGQGEIAEDYFEKAYDISLVSENLSGQTAILNNWAILLYNTGKYEEALQKHLASLEINIKLGNNIYIGRSFHNLGVTSQSLGKYDQSLNYFLKARRIREEIEYYNGLAETQCQLADLFFDMKIKGINTNVISDKLMKLGYSSPFRLLDDVLTLPGMSENIGVILMVNETKIKGNEIYGNFQEAYRLLKMQKVMEDSLVLSDSNMKALADLKIKYEKELLFAQNELNEVEIEKRKTGQILLGALSFILLGTLLFLLQYFRQRRNLRNLEYRSILDNKLGIISQLQGRISEILDQRKDSLELRPLSELNDLIDTPLTDKEYEVLQAVAGGKTNREIAEEQFISENTVKFHLKNIYFKLDVGNRREAVKRLLSLV